MATTTISGKNTSIILSNSLTKLSGNQDSIKGQGAFDSIMHQDLNTSNKAGTFLGNISAIKREELVVKPADSKNVEKNNGGLVEKRAADNSKSFSSKNAAKSDNLRVVDKRAVDNKAADTKANKAQGDKHNTKQPQDDAEGVKEQELSLASESLSSELDVYNNVIAQIQSSEEDDYFLIPNEITAEEIEESNHEELDFAGEDQIDLFARAGDEDAAISDDANANDNEINISAVNTDEKSSIEENNHVVSASSVSENDISDINNGQVNALEKSPALNSENNAEIDTTTASTAQEASDEQFSLVSGAELELLQFSAKAALDTEGQVLVGKNTHVSHNESLIPSSDLQEASVDINPQTIKNGDIEKGRELLADAGIKYDIEIEGDLARNVTLKETAIGSLIQGGSHQMLAEDITTAAQMQKLLAPADDLKQGEIRNDVIEDLEEATLQVSMEDLEGNAGGFENNSNKNMQQKTPLTIANYGGEITSSANDKAMKVDFAKSLAQKTEATPPKPAEQLNLSLKHAMLSGKSELKLNLYPRSLGAVEVTMEVSKDSITGLNVVSKIKISAENRQSLEMLEKSQAELAKTLSEVKESEDASLEFDMKKRGDSTENGMHYSSEEERQAWMAKFADVNEHDGQEGVEEAGLEVAASQEQQNDARRGEYSIGNLNLEV